MKTLRWGIAGPGRIAKKFASSRPFFHSEITAVASTSAERASAFATEFQLPFWFGSYQEMLGSGGIDALYVATTNTFHKEIVRQALEKGIAVLCEKPMVLSALETSELIQISKLKGVFLMEGMWSLFLPHIQQALAWIAAGRIGKLQHMYADFAFKAHPDPESRIFNPNLGGGVARDIGIYPLALFLHFGGPFGEWQFQTQRSTSGVSDHVLFQGLCLSGVSFQGMVSFRMQSGVEAHFLGDKGTIRLSAQWLRPTSAILRTETGEEVFSPQVHGFGFQYEVQEVEKKWAEGKIESKIWSHEKSLLVAGYLDKIENM